MDTQQSLSDTNRQSEPVQVWPGGFRTRFLFLTAWAVWGAVFGLATYVSISAGGEELPILPFVINSTISWLFWPAVIPLIASLGRRFPVTQSNWASSLGIHLLFSIIFGFAQFLFFVGVGTVTWHLWSEVPLSQAFGLFGFKSNLYLNSAARIFVYWFILGGWFALRHFRESQQRQIRAEQLQRQLSDARMEAVRGNLQPHFLFNTLHIAASLVEKGDRKQAITVLSMLSDLLRHSLEQLDAERVPLAVERQALQKYLAIVQLRYSDRLTIEQRFSEETDDILVPGFILQPLVENAVRHGVERCPGNATIRIQAKNDGNSLHLEVHNESEHAYDAEPEPPGTGLGLETTRRRLRNLYQDKATLELITTGHCSATARITLPLERVDKQTIESTGE